MCANGHLNLARVKVGVANGLQNAVAAFAKGADVDNAVLTKSKMLIEVSCNDSNSGNNEWFIDLKSYYLALNYHYFSNFHSVSQRTLKATFDDYGFPRHLNIGLDLMLKNIYDNNQ